MNIESYHSCDSDLKWYDLYGKDQKFKGYLSPETNKHPAKMSMRLADYILMHLEHLNLIHKGDRIIDFMAGTARTGVIAELHGYSFTGIELESHFIDMIEENRKTVKSKLLRDPSWNIIQGDARHLSEILKENGSAVVSPPYGDSTVASFTADGVSGPVGKNARAKENRKVKSKKFPSLSGYSTSPKAPSQQTTKYSAITSPAYGQAEDRNRYKTQEGNVTEVKGRQYDKSNHGTSEGQIGNLKDVGVVSPAYGQSVSSKHGGIDPHPERAGGSHIISEGYSDNPENIGNLKDAGLVSPTYANTKVGKNSKGIDLKKQYKTYRKSGGGMSYEAFVQQQMSHSHEYSDNPENIGNLKDAGLVSPPYTDRHAYKDSKRERALVEKLKANSTSNIGSTRMTEHYSTNERNISNSENETYLSAMLQVYSEAFKSGISPLVTVTKNPTKNHQLRRLDLDTAKLLEMAGYKIIDYHQAVLFRQKKQVTLTGEEKTVIDGQASFFKRLSIQKGNVAADHEDILIAVIPDKKY